MRLRNLMLAKTSVLLMKKYHKIEEETPIVRILEVGMIDKFLSTSPPTQKKAPHPFQCEAFPFIYYISFKQEQIYITSKSSRFFIPPHTPLSPSL